jgi:hypothetical protein
MTKTLIGGSAVGVSNRHNIMRLRQFMVRRVARGRKKCRDLSRFARVVTERASCDGRRLVLRHPGLAQASEKGGFGQRTNLLKERVNVHYPDEVRYA